MSRSQRAFLYDRAIFMTVAYLAALLAVPQGAFAWGREGHQIIAIVAEHYMRPETTARMGELLAPESPEEASARADGYRRDRRETGPERSRTAGRTVRRLVPLYCGQVIPNVLQISVPRPPLAGGFWGVEFATKATWKMHPAPRLLDVSCVASTSC
jgi:hypothetical protein